MAQLEEELAKELCDIIRGHVAAATKPLRARIEELELRKNRPSNSNIAEFGARARATAWLSILNDEVLPDEGARLAETPGVAKHTAGVRERAIEKMQSPGGARWARLAVVLGRVLHKISGVKYRRRCVG